MEIQNATLESGEVAMAQLEARSAPILDRYSKLKQYCNRFTAILGRTPRSAPLYVRLNELSDSLSTLTKDRKSLSDGLLEWTKSAEKYTESNVTKSRAFDNLSSSLQSTLEDIRIRETEAERISGDASDLRNQMAELNEVRRREYDNGQSRLGEIQTTVDKERSELVSLQGKLASLDRIVSELPGKAKDAQSEFEISVAKKKQLMSEIQRKIDTQIQEIITQQSKSPVIVKLTAQLEKHWSEHAKISESIERFERKLYGLQEGVERRKLIATELKMNYRSRTADGLKAQEEIYQAARNQNDEYAQKMAVLQRELFIFESEQAQFLRTLAELT
jgi:DNA repair exonuclease SbcCD ATPase subunit